MSTTDYNIKLIKESFNLKELTQVFNDSFSDYVIPFSETEESLSQKIKGDDMSMDYSIGIYSNIDNKLVGFIMHAPNKPESPTLLYNCMTGIIPSARGNKFIEKGYIELSNQLKSQNSTIKSIILEVIDTNVRARKVYENSGFEIVRSFLSYRGTFNLNQLKQLLLQQQQQPPTESVQFIKLTELNIDEIESFQSTIPNLMKPSYLSSLPIIKREFDLGFNNCWIAKHNDDKIIGFLSINSKTKRIRQIVVSQEFRNQNIATSLIYNMFNTDFNNDESILFNIANIDSNCTSLINFFNKRLNFNFFVSQKEMECTL